MTTKIVATSDLHGTLEAWIPNGDILLIGGDICPAFNHTYDFQYSWIHKTFLPWCVAKIDQKQFGDIVFIAGNHDFFFEEIYLKSNENKFIKNLPAHVHYLRDSGTVINGITIHGTPWTPVFYDWAFMKPDADLSQYFDKIPDNVDFLITHGPPHGCNDCVGNRVDHLGSKSLKDAIMRKNVKYNVFGHIHTGDHEVYTFQNSLENDCNTVNVSLVDERYNVAFKPFSTVV